MVVTLSDGTEIHISEMVLATMDPERFKTEWRRLMSARAAKVYVHAMLEGKE